MDGNGETSPASRPAVHWNRQYYDSMAYHFWEPQHIGRTRDPDARIRTEADAIARLKTLEVVLNHQMELFFRLAPDDFVRRLFRSAFGNRFDDRYRIVGREFHQVFAVEGLTQPDLLFEGKEAVVAIELKLGAKSSLEQLIKYACLFSLMPQVQGGRGLLFMGPGEFSGLWRAKFADVDALRAALAETAVEDLRPRLRRFLAAHGSPLPDLLDGLRIAYMSYADFHASLAAEAASGQHHETWARLLAGMMAELEERNLVQPGSRSAE